MNRAIKKRIEDINNGIVPEGYKQTPFGIFPCDWETDKKYGDLFEFNSSLSKSREELGEYGYPYLHYGDMHRNSFNNVSYEQYSILPKVDIDIIGKEKYLMEDGDVAFLDASEDLEGTSRCVLIDNPNNEPFFAGLHTLPAREKAYNFSKWYKQYITLPDYVRKQFQRLACGFKVYGLNKETIAKINYAFPEDKTEQSKIAEILMKWDETVELQEQYIQKLELRKKAIMKKLLAPKDGWKKCKLKDFIKVKSGYAFKSETYVENGKYQILTIKNVQRGLLDLNEISTISELPSNIQKHQILALDDIIISLTGNVGRSCYITKENCLLNQRVGKVECSNVYKQFVYAILQTDDFINAMINIAQGGAQANLSNEDIENFEVFIPFINEYIDKDTVYNIGQINLKTDEEISLQKEKRDKIKEQRKTMQQYLLTGIVRVG